jgi:hypothetical protein
VAEYGSNEIYLVSPAVRYLARSFKVRPDTKGFAYSYTSSLALWLRHTGAKPWWENVYGIVGPFIGTLISNRPSELMWIANSKEAQ